MTKEDIIRMAREAGLGDTGVREGFIFFQPGTDGLERFAALVAAAEREAVIAIVNDNSDSDGVCCTDDLLAAIRARG